VVLKVLGKVLRIKRGKGEQMEGFEGEERAMERGEGDRGRGGRG
jgi:hypothetical protein